MYGFQMDSSTRELYDFRDGYMTFVIHSTRNVNEHNFPPEM